MLTRPHFLINENLRATRRVPEARADARRDRADDAETNRQFRPSAPTIAQNLGRKIRLNAEQLCLLAAGIFFSSGLLTGWWKYRCIAASAQAVAPVYVDIAHRTSLMYAFSAVLLREFVPYSPLSETGTLWAAGLPLLFFALAISMYIVHGILRDTDNQMRAPHRLGPLTLPGAAIHAFMWALAVAEIGGFAVLFYGFASSLRNI
ncbi:MAG: hypothetical protein K0Q76_1956 [Panacagrimonas sp.]|nr:hypothetical protein [Panacagrimonas sp.]